MADNQPQHADDVRPSLNIWRDRLTGQLQVEVSEGATGYRIAGPTFLGDSDLLLRHIFTERDADEIGDVLARIERTDG